MIAYRIYEERDGQLYPLQHKTRTPVPLNEWMQADVKMARDGSGNRWYKAGFHSVPRIEDAEAYMQHFRSARRERLRVVEVEVSNTWSKDHSPAPVILSEYMLVKGIVTTQNTDFNPRSQSCDLGEEA
jgi:hypothetical protein